MLSIIEEFNRMKRQNSRKGVEFVSWESSSIGNNDVLKKALMKYLNSEWTLLNNQIGGISQLGVLLFHNNKNKAIEAVSVTVNELQKVYNLGDGTTSLLGKFKTDRQAEALNILPAKGSYIEAIKILSAISNLGDILKGSELGSVHVVSLTPFKQDADIILSNTIIQNFNTITAILNRELKDTHIKNNFINGKIKVIDKFDELYQKIITNTFAEVSSFNVGSKVSEVIAGFNLGEELPITAQERLK
jgi:hypothetical protein